MWRRENRFAPRRWSANAAFCLISANAQRCSKSSHENTGLIHVLATRVFQMHSHFIDFSWSTHRSERVPKKGAIFNDLFKETVSLLRSKFYKFAQAVLAKLSLSGTKSIHDSRKRMRLRIQNCILFLVLKASKICSRSLAIYFRDTSVNSSCFFRKIVWTSILFSLIL